jgi:hypothetical protein
MLSILGLAVNSATRGQGCPSRFKVCLRQVVRAAAGAARAFCHFVGRGSLSLVL